MSAVIILRGIFYLFGLFELTTNILYLSRKNGILKAYNQHKEIPASVSQKRMKIKVISMLTLGIALTGTLVFSFFNFSMAQLLLKGVMAIYTVYTIGEALSYRSHKLGWALTGLITVLTAALFLL